MSGHLLIRLLVGLYLLVVLGIFFYLFWGKLRFVLGGRPENRLDRIGTRIGVFLAEVIGQTKVRRRMVAGWAHALVFWGFLVFMASTVNLLWRLAAGGEGFLHGPAGWISYVVDAFAIAILAGVLYFAVRRYILRPDYLTYNSNESALVLTMIGLIALTHIGERILPQPGGEYSGYLHLMVAFSFLAYVPTSKHFHLISGPFNAFFQQLSDTQKMDRMDIEAELDESKGEAYGVNTLDHFTWKDRLDLVSCIECGRCQEACPAHATGKLLNPKEFIVDLKYQGMGKPAPGKQAGVARAAWEKAGRPGADLPSTSQPLIEHIIADQTLWECTSCMGCVAACPMDIDHLSKLLNMRRYRVLDEGRISEEIQKTFRNMEEKGDPWGYGERHKQETVGKWTGVPVAREGESFDVLFWVGCWGLYDERNGQASQAILKTLNHYGVDYRIIGDEEACCGENARRMGNELVFQMNAQTNLELFQRYKFRRLVVANPHCYQIFRKDYKDLVPEEWNGELPFEVLSIEELAWDLVRKDGLPGERDLGAVTYHDSCFYGRYNGLYDPQRQLVRRAGGRLIEMPRSREGSFCCGAGGGQMWLDEKAPRVSWNRAEEIMKTGAGTVAVSCPFCVEMLRDGLKAQDGYDQRPIQVKHVLELIAEALPDAD
jgi:Fe-S oxidoreductase